MRLSLSLGLGLMTLEKKGLVFPHNVELPSAVNLIPNPTLPASTGWTLEAGASFVTSQDYNQDGSGSFEMTDTSFKGVISPIIDLVASGTGWYKMRYFCLADDQPSLYGSQIKFYDSGFSFIRNDWGLSRGDVAMKDLWYEVCKMFYVDVVLTPKCALHVFKAQNPDSRTGKVYMDFPFIGRQETPTFIQPPTPNRAFSGARVKIDQLGNWFLENAGSYDPFFPAFMHVDGARSDFTAYPAAGWNANIWASTDVNVAKDEAAGLWSLFKLADYIIPPADPISQLNTRLQLIIDNGNLVNVIGYYWDNETAESEWDVPIAVIAAVRAKDTGAPLYILEGNEHLARAHSANNVSDVTGRYASTTPDDLFSDRTFPFEVLRDQPGHSAPASIAQLNGQLSHPGQLRLSTWNAIIEGARGVAYFGDNLLSNPPIEEAPFAHDSLPLLTDCKTTYLPLIQTPHWTEFWSATSSNANILVGTRDYSGKRYLIITNQTSLVQTVTITVTGVTITDGTKVTDLRDGWEVAEFSSNAFTFDMDRVGSHRGNMVLEIDGAGIITTDFNLQARFESEDPAPLDDPYIADEGQLTTLQIATGGDMSTTGGELIIPLPTGGWGWGNQGIIADTGLTRELGRCLFARVNFTKVDSMNLGFGLVSTLTQNLNAGFRFETGSLRYNFAGSVIPIRNTGLSTATVYDLCVSYDTQSRNRAAALIKGGTFGTNWNLLCVLPTSSNSTGWPQIANFDGGVKCDYFASAPPSKIPWFPKPLLADTFDGADVNTTNFPNRVTDGNLTGYKGGSGWTYTVSSGTWETLSNRLNSATIGADGLLLVDINESDLVGEGIGQAPSGSGGGVVFRGVDSSNYWVWGLNITTGDYEMISVSAGVPTVQGTITASVAASTDTELNFSCDGDKIRGWAGTTMLEITSTIHQTATQVGFKSTVVGTKFASLALYGVNQPDVPAVITSD